MTPKQKAEYIIDRMSHWKQRLDLPRGLKIKTSFVTHREEDEECTHGKCHMQMLPYKSVTIEFYDELMSEKNFREEAEKTVIHELLHIVLHPLIAFVSSLAPDSQASYISELEEIIITTLEEAFITKGEKDET